VVPFERRLQPDNASRCRLSLALDLSRSFGPEICCFKVENDDGSTVKAKVTTRIPKCFLATAVELPVFFDQRLRRDSQSLLWSFGEGRIAFGGQHDRNRKDEK